MNLIENDRVVLTFVSPLLFFWTIFPPLEDIIDKKYKDLAVLMGMAPVDPSMAVIFQNAVSTILKNDNESSPEARYPSKKDPAVSAEHGHQSGVRRNSAEEEKQAEENRPEE